MPLPGVDESGLGDFAGQGSGLSAEPGPLFRSGHLKHLAMRAGDVVSAPARARPPFASHTPSAGFSKPCPVCIVSCMSPCI